MAINARNYIEQVSDMSKDELDELPIGVITLAPDGTVKRYNKAESLLARKDQARVIGSNFFTEVAPCTANANFQGRFEELVAKEWGVVNFDYAFKFPWGNKDVHVTFIKKKAHTDVDTLITWK